MTECCSGGTRLIIYLLLKDIAYMASPVKSLRLKNSVLIYIFPLTDMPPLP